MAEEKNEELETTQKNTNDIDGLEAIDENQLPEPNELESVDNESGEDETQTYDDGSETTEKTTEESEESTEEEIQEYSVQKKLGLVQKILIGTVGFLLVIVIIGAVMYFTGFFDPEPPKVEVEAPKQEVEVVPEKEKYLFKPDDINEARINRKLALLTKYELVEDPEKEREKQEELKKEQEYQAKQKEKEAIEQKVPQINIEDTKTEQNAQTTEPNAQQENSTTEEATKQDDTMVKEDQQQAEVETEQPKEVLDISEEEVDDNKNDEELLVKQYEGEKFLKFVQVATLKYKLYNTFLSQIKDLDARISVCKYKNNQTQIFIGPFENEDNREKILEKINQNIAKDAFRIEFTQEEFESRCNF